MIAAISVIVALAAGLAAYASVKPVAAASTHVFVDTATPSVLHRPIYPVSALVQRAELLGRVMTSPPLLEDIARRADVPKDQLAGEARTTARVPAAFLEPGSEERASAISDADLPYRIEVQGRFTSPVLDVYTHAPSTATAERLAQAAVDALEQRIATIGGEADRVVLRQLGPPRGGVVNAGMAIAVGVVAFMLALALVYAALRHLTAAGVPRVRRREPPPRPDDAWPHTSRLMPWSFAGFLAVVWLMPFDEILLKVPMPIDLTFDRLVLPIVIAVWLLAWLAGGTVRPRVRLTPIHVAVAAFVTIAFLSVIMNAGALNQAVELDAAVKRLPLLVTYILVFVIASTAVRSGEVRAFLTYTLALAVVCSLGVLWEYRFKQNLFYQWSDKLLPGIFDVPRLDSGAVDDAGRRVVQGPAAVPLETVAMLAMALPIPLVRFTQAGDRRQRILYGLAAVLIFAAAFATFRKSALLAPVSVIATIGYFRRRELLKLAPLGLVLVVLVPVLAPGAVGMTTTQFEPSRLGVATVSDRASDYDAVRPDVWSHIMLGRGWGSYSHVTYRVLDSEILHRLIEMGVLGLLSYLVMIGSVVWTARATIAERDRRWAPLALIGTAAAVAFGVVSTLFDVMSFPHAVYGFLFMAGLVSVVVSHHRDDDRHGTEHLVTAPPPPPRLQPAGGPRAPVPSPAGVASRSS